MAAGSDEPVAAACEAGRLEEGVRALERPLGRKTMEVERLARGGGQGEGQGGGEKQTGQLPSPPRDGSR